MEKGKAREFDLKWIEDGPIEPYWRVSRLDAHNRHRSDAIHVREVIPLTDDEKRRIKKLRNMNNSDSESFLLDLLERAGVV